MTVLRCDSCGADTFEALGEPGYFRCHNCGAASTVKLAQPVGVFSGGPGVWLLSPGPKKIEVIKVVRELTGLSLKEAKNLVDASEKAPQLIPSSGDSGTVERGASMLIAAGAGIRR